jgi:hypothetical protein
MVAIVGNNKVAFTVKSDTTIACSELSVAAAFAADGAHEGAVAHSKHLHAIVAMVTDYDCWHPGHDHVTVDQVVKILNGNAENARKLLKALAPLVGPVRTPSPLGIETTLDTALITAPEKRDASLVAKLDAIAGRVLKGN